MCCQFELGECPRVEHVTQGWNLIGITRGEPRPRRRESTAWPRRRSRPRCATPKIASEAFAPRTVCSSGNQPPPSQTSHLNRDAIAPARQHQNRDAISTARQLDPPPNNDTQPGLHKGLARSRSSRHVLYRAWSMLDWRWAPTPTSRAGGIAVPKPAYTRSPLENGDPKIVLRPCTTAADIWESIEPS